jgi:hypothetical protein
MSLYERILTEGVSATDLAKYGDLVIVPKASVRKAGAGKWDKSIETFSGATAVKDAEAFIRKGGYKKTLVDKKPVWKLKAAAVKKQMAAKAKAKKKADAVRNRQIALWGGQQKLDALKSAFEGFMRWAGGSHDRVEFRVRTYGGKTTSEITAGLRDYDLPKEGAYDMGYADYDALVDSTIKKHMKSFKQRVAPYMPNNATVSVSDGEKSWLYFNLSPGKTKPRGFGKPKIK